MPFGEQHNELPIGASPVIPHSANHALCCTNGSPVHQPLLQPAQSAYHTALAKLDEASQKWWNDHNVSREQHSDACGRWIVPSRH